MKRADLHVHSKYSAHPSEWFLQRIGTRESYTEPEDLYRDAKAKGMDFVTITDHNCVCGVMKLKEAHPNDVITGCEFTTYFPENECKVHVLVWGLDRRHFDEISEIRHSIYELREYLKEHDLTHAVAHATFSVNRRLDADLVEKMILLFDHFEGLNGGREQRSNQFLISLLESLTPAKIDELQRKHGIVPYGSRPWIKGITGGSDDHGGLFIASAYTCAEDDADTAEEFLGSIRRKHTTADGRHNDYRSFALSLYKIAWEFSKSRSSGLSNSLFSVLSGMVFSGEKLGLKQRLAIKPMMRKQAKLGEALEKLINDIQKSKTSSIDDRVEKIYRHAANFSDLFFEQFVQRISESIRDGDLSGVLRNVSGMLPAVFISLPFFTTLSVINGSRSVSDELKRRHFPAESPRNKRVLWFTDTFTDLNGVSETLQKLAQIGYDENLHLRIVTTEQGDVPGVARDMIMEIAQVGEYPISFFKGLTLRIPSLLDALQKISEFNADELVISTPGPVGLVGLTAAKLLNLKVSGIYHTDFTSYTKIVTDDENVTLMVNDLIKLFYSQMDQIFVPSQAYRRILVDQGYESEKLTTFRRGVDPVRYSPDNRDRGVFGKRYGVSDGVNMIYAGRISEEKNSRKLIDLFVQLRRKVPTANLILCGDGPLYEELSAKYGSSYIVFTGRLKRDDLATLYASADLLLFPSVTDTFGMAVLEAQMAGTPAIVTDRGGPQEIIVNGKTGAAVSISNGEAWVDAMVKMAEMVNHFPEEYLELRHRTRSLAMSRFSWAYMVKDVLGIELDHDPVSEMPGADLFSFSSDFSTKAAPELVSAGF